MQTQSQGETCFGLQDTQVRDGAAGPLSRRTADRLTTAQGHCPHKGHSVTASHTMW